MTVMTSKSPLNGTRAIENQKITIHGSLAIENHQIDGIDFMTSHVSWCLPTMWGPQTMAKLVNITPISLWFMVFTTVVSMVYGL